MFRSGGFVADHVRPTDDEQVQPNGVDLTLEAILEPVEPGWIGRDGTSVGDRRTIEPSEPERSYRLDPGGYVARYGEIVAIPEDHVGFVLPRSSLMRNGATLETAVWDAGYEGRGEGLLTVEHEIELEQDARIGQFVLAEAAASGTYEGTYDGEGL